MTAKQVPTIPQTSRTGPSQLETVWVTLRTLDSGWRTYYSIDLQLEYSRVTVDKAVLF